jgi:anthranilate synthase component 1
MINPKSNEIKELAKGYSILPICREMYADVITPITLLRKLSGVSKQYFLLESVEGGERWGRYSFLGFDPIIHVTCKNGLITETDNNKSIAITKDPFEYLRDILNKYKAPRLRQLPPFTGGLVGYFGYEMIGYAESVLKLKKSDFHDFDLMLFDKVIAYDHLKQKINIIVNIKTDSLIENYDKALSDIDKIVSLINEPLAIKKQTIKSSPDFSCNVNKEEFCKMVEKTKEYIRDGDIFQAVISRRFETNYKDSLINGYRVLRTSNPSPYMVYLQNGETEVMASSPETLVRVKHGRVTTFPIAGSRPRGKNREEDLFLENELLNDQKEISEHNMLVDLARNDLSMISKIDSVNVVRYMEIQKYSRIMHITSEVEGELEEGRDIVDALKALLPAGTLSGAPKIRACEIIDELEADPRGIYGGAIGYMDFTGNMDTCIAIRMAVKKDNKVYVQAGAGIVADSVPHMEYEESQNKANAVIEALINAGEVEKYDSYNR